MLIVPRFASGSTITKIAWGATINTLIHYYTREKREFRALRRRSDICISRVYSLAYGDIVVDAHNVCGVPSSSSSPLLKQHHHFQHIQQIRDHCSVAMIARRTVFYSTRMYTHTHSHSFHSLLFLSFSLSLWHDQCVCM
mgnify:CR=1 FL=1